MVTVDKPWVKDLLFVGLCLAGLAALVLAFAPVPGLRAEPLTPPRRVPSERAELEAVAGRVDAALRVEQAAAGVTASPRADTLTVARRLSLALTGTIPSLEEIRALEAQPEDEALAWWVDHLLVDRRHADYLAERLARPLVGVEQGSLILYRRRRFVAWLSEQLADNEPWDRISRRMIADTGLWTQHPQTNFVTAAIKPGASVPDEEVLAGRVSRAFLGIRLDCAQCHDHPFDDRWTQADFQGLAAFFGRSKATLVGIQEVRGAYEYDDPRVAQPVVIAPTVPFSPELLPDAGPDRERLAAWVTHRENRAFSRAIVNRIWALMLGRPLVEPVDDLSIDAPGSPVVDILADDLVAHDFDLHRLLRAIAATETFARESRSPDAEAGADEGGGRGVEAGAGEGGGRGVEAGAGEDRGRGVEAGAGENHSPEIESAAQSRDGADAEDERVRLRARMQTWAEFPLTRLRPEQIVGALLQSASLTTVDHESHVLLRLARFAQQSQFIARYGDAGEDELEPESGTIPQRLLMLNGDIVHARTKDDLVGNAATRIALLARDDANAVEVAYLAVLSRRPSTAEADYFAARLAGLDGDARRAAISDLYWALLNSTEFAWNH